MAKLFFPKKKGRMATKMNCMVTQSLYKQLYQVAIQYNEKKVPFVNDAT
jgi:hypothetical protein